MSGISAVENLDMVAISWRGAELRAVGLGGWSASNRAYVFDGGGVWMDSSVKA